MKIKHALLVGLAALSLVAASARAQVVGYVNTTFQPGANWFGNPLVSSNDMLSSLIPTAPVGTTVSLFGGPTATFGGGMWSTDFTLNPGTGAILTTPSQFLNTFTGTVLDFNGAGLAGLNAPFHQPAPFAGSHGFYLFSSVAPVGLSGTGFTAMGGPWGVFESIIGRDPNAGEQVTTLNPLTQTETTSTFNGTSWDIDPSLPVGQAAMFNIGPVPEPGTNALMLLGLGAFGFALWRKRSLA